MDGSGFVKTLGLSDLALHHARRARRHLLELRLPRLHPERRKKRQANPVRYQDPTSQRSQYRAYHHYQVRQLSIPLLFLGHTERAQT